MHELIALHVGQCGTQVGTSFWELLAHEHHLQLDGNLADNVLDVSADLHGNLSMFQESSIGTFHPRAIFCDLEPDPISDLFSSSSAFHTFVPTNQCITWRESACYYNRAHYTTGKEIIDPVLEALRKQVEKCESLNGFVTTAAFSGGTGSGFTSLLLERMCVEYGRKLKVTLPVMPSIQEKRVTSCVVAPYDALLALHSTVEHSDLDILVDNQSLYQACTASLAAHTPVSFHHTNQLLASLLSDITLSHRFPAQPDLLLSHCVQNLVTQPRAHYVIPSRLSESGKGPATHELITEMSHKVLSDHSLQLLSCEAGKKSRAISSSALVYRGDVGEGHVMQALQFLKGNIPLHPAVPSPFTFSLSPRFPLSLTPSLDDDKQHHDNDVQLNSMCRASIPASLDRSLSALTLSQSFISYLEGLTHNFDVLYAQRAFVHWYVGEGLSEGEFAEARNDLEELKSFYGEVFEGVNAGEQDEL